MYSGLKMARILASYGIDVDEFVDAYDKLPRKLDLWKAPDEYEVACIEGFLQHQDMRELCKDLEVTQQGAFKVLTRYLIWSFEAYEEVSEENGTSEHRAETAEIVVSV